MLKHKNIDKICCIVLAICLLITVLFMNGEQLGISSYAINSAYEEKLFSTLTVHEINIIVDEDDWSSLLINASDKEYIVCNIQINDDLITNAAIRTKGNSSLSTVASSTSDRYSFKIEFDHYDSTNLFYGLDKLCLNNIIQDTTYMKDYLAYTMMSDFGIPSPLCNYANVSINGVASGLYLAVEAIEESFLQRNYGNNYGNAYKPETDSNAGGGGGDMQGGMAGDMQGGMMGGMQGGMMGDMTGEIPGDFDINMLFDEEGNLLPEVSEMLLRMPTEMIDILLQELPEESRLLLEELLQNQTDSTLPQSNDMQSDMPGGMTGTVPNDTQGDMPGGTTGTAPNDTQGGMTGTVPNDTQGDMTGDMAGGMQGGMTGDMQGGMTGDMQGDMTGGMAGGMQGGMTGGMQGGMAGGMNQQSTGSTSSSALGYIDDNVESYSYFFDNAVTNPSSKDKTNTIEALKNLSNNTNLESAIDIEQVIRYFVVHNYLLNFDSYTGSIMHNYYVYEDNGILSMLPWDYNLSFSSFMITYDTESLVNFPIDTPISTGTLESRPMLSWIFESDEYTALYHELFGEFISLQYESGYLEDKINSIYTVIAPYVQNDPTMFYTYEQFEGGVSTLIEFNNLRSQSILGQLNGTIGSTSETQTTKENFIDASHIDVTDTGNATTSIDQGGMNREQGGMSTEQNSTNREQNGTTTEQDSMNREQSNTYTESGDTIPNRTR